MREEVSRADVGKVNRAQRRRDSLYPKFRMWNQFLTCWNVVDLTVQMFSSALIDLLEF